MPTSRQQKEQSASAGNDIPCPHKKKGKSPAPIRLKWTKNRGRHVHTGFNHVHKEGAKKS